MFEIGPGTFVILSDYSLAIKNEARIPIRVSEGIPFQGPYNVFFSLGPWEPSPRLPTLGPREPAPSGTRTLGRPGALGPREPPLKGRMRPFKGPFKCI